MDEANGLEFFDSNCRLGPDPFAPRGAPVTAEDMLAAMDRAGISEALVYSSISQLYMPSAGNSRILEETAASDRLHSAWVLLPESSGELGEHCVAAMLRAGVKAARLFPAAHRFALSRWCAETLLSDLAHARAPVFLDYGVGHWSGREVAYGEIAELCAAFPRLPVVLVGVGMADDRMLFPLMDRFPNLRLELSYYQAERGIEEICDRFGARRLLFGTGMPKFPAGGAVTYVTYARVRDEDKAAIAGGNLRRLLQRVRA